MAVQFEQLDLSGYAKINDTKPSASTTYSSQKIEEILPEAGAVIDDSEASTTKTYSSTHIDETYLKKEGNGSGVSVEYTESDTGSAPASGSMLGNLIGWIVGKCNGIGNISNLLTVAKSNLVAAINELRGEIGDLTQLDTTEKTDLVAAINKLNSNNAWGERQTIGQSIGLSVFFLRNSYMYQIEVSGNINGSSIPLGGKKLCDLPDEIVPPSSTHRYMSTDSRLSVQVNTAGEIWLYSSSNISSTSSGINVAFTEPLLS